MKKHARASVMVATTLLAGAAVPAVAQTALPPAAVARGDVPPPPRGPMPGGGLIRADANRDGIVTREEVIADADRRFAALDTNGDGKIDRNEMQAAHDIRRSDGRDDGPRGGMRRARTRNETRDRALRMFDRADTDHDGRVGAQELDAMRLLMRARFAAPADGDDRARPPAGNEQP